MQPIPVPNLTRIVTTMLALTLAPALDAQQIDVWIGTGGNPSKGIYHCQLDTGKGKLGPSRLAAEMSSPGFLAMHPNLPILYAVGALDGQPVVAAFRIVHAGEYPNLEFINSQPIGDGGATHLSISKDAKCLLTAQYGSGSVAAFALNPDGSVQARTQLIKHSGGSRAYRDRQDTPHAHWVGFSPDQQFALVPDLGLDEVVIYQVDTATAQLKPHGSGKVAAGAGPRHMKFHQNGKWIYVLNELDLTVSLFDWDASAGTMTLRQTVPTVDKPDLDREQFTSCSEIRIHPQGNFVYAANRGHDTISVFQVAEDGSLERQQIMPVRGATPRNFNIDPSGRWLLAAGQDSHTLAAFVVDPSTGLLTYNRSVITTPAPICVVMTPE